MPWFKVDDSFHAHPKVLATDPDALGLWVVAGSWSSANLQDGYVPDHVLPRLLPDSATLAKKLVTAGLWHKVRGGHRFHDFGDYNPEREDIEEDRKAARERMRKLRSRRRSAGQDGNGSREQGANVRDMFVTPARPGPNPQGGSARARDAPPPRCPDHLDNPDPPPCGRCADARRARQRWEADDAQRRRDAPSCRRHRGQPADNCALCRSEAIGAKEQP